MDIRLTSTVFQIFAHDVQRSLGFYRLLGLAVPESTESHVAVELPGGNTLAFDTEETITGMHPGWTPPTTPGRLALAFEVGSPAEVDALFDVVTGRSSRTVEALRRAMGSALCDRRGSRRQLGRSVRVAC